LEEAQYEALERQEAAPTAATVPNDDQIEHRIAQQDVDRFATMLRDEPAKNRAHHARSERRHGNGMRPMKKGPVKGGAKSRRKPYQGEPKR
jgi:hypothetical protein